jgi:hypothetical protein
MGPYLLYPKLKLSESWEIGGMKVNFIFFEIKKQMIYDLRFTIYDFGFWILDFGFWVEGENLF